LWPLSSLRNTLSRSPFLAGYYLSRLYINIRQRITGKIDQKFVSRGGAENHGGMTRTLMLTQVETELAVTITIGVFRAVFLPQRKPR
jgi:hypothetical protein